MAVVSLRNRQSPLWRVGSCRLLVLNSWHGSTARRDPATRQGLDLVVDAGKRPVQRARESVHELAATADVRQVPQRKEAIVHSVITPSAATR